MNQRIGYVADYKKNSHLTKQMTLSAKRTQDLPKRSSKKRAKTSSVKVMKNKL